MQPINTGLNLHQPLLFIDIVEPLYSLFKYSTVHFSLRDQNTKQKESIKEILGINEIVRNKLEHT